KLFGEYDPEGDRYIRDPYYGGLNGFERNFQQKETKPVSGPSVHFHQVTADNSVIGINSGSFGVNIISKRDKEDEK
ncbi:8482_t:CDS:2, partial [Ambispora leptoticha]